MSGSVLSLFATAFKATPTLTGQAPGRVNLIGEHIDYNGGSVLPCTLPLTLQVALRPRTDTRVRVVAEGYPAADERDIWDSVRGHWTDHTVGALRMGQELGLVAGGADVAIRSAIPAGAGLSSSAALLVAMLKAMRSADEHSLLGDIDIALLAQRIEREYIGLPCGIMDQFIVAVGEPGEAILLDTDRLTHEHIALPTAHTFAVVHSGITRELSDGRYARRSLECEQAEIAFATDKLCTLSLARVETADDVDPILRARARHCVTEHQRVLAAAGALGEGRLDALGRLMNESHRSMRDDFDMSLPAIDHLVADAVALGAVGSRLTGGGFGGCTVSLLPRDRLKTWADALLERHPEARWVGTTG